jgi:hypothetical protein
MLDSHPVVFASTPNPEIDLHRLHALEEQIDCPVIFAARIRLDIAHSMNHNSDGGNGRIQDIGRQLRRSSRLGDPGMSRGTATGGSCSGRHD